MSVAKVRKDLLPVFLQTVKKMTIRCDADLFLIGFTDEKADLDCDTTSSQKRGAVAVFHPSLKSNAHLAKFPTFKRESLSLVDIAQFLCALLPTTHQRLSIRL
jgi:hypothetical protein